MGLMEGLDLHKEWRSNEGPLYPRFLPHLMLANGEGVVIRSNTCQLGPNMPTSVIGGCA